MKAGKIIEAGNHMDLMSVENGVYKKMVEKQLEPSDFFSNAD
jgi:ABC-type multidrug transport system fused ATPase/permease subunit